MGFNWIIIYPFIGKALAVFLKLSTMGLHWDFIGFHWGLKVDFIDIHWGEKAKLCRVLTLYKAPFEGS